MLINHYHSDSSYNQLHVNNTDTSHLSFGCDNRTKQHSRYKRLHYTKDPNNKLLVCKATKNNHSYPNILQCLCNLLDNIRFVSSNSIWFHVILFLVSRSQLFLRKKIFTLEMPVLTTLSESVD